MRRRDFLARSLASGVAVGFLGKDSQAFKGAGSHLQNDFRETPGLTKYVADFVVNTKYSEIPETVIELGKKSILDSLGLALAGSVDQTAQIIRSYVQPFVTARGVTAIGRPHKLPARFAAFANGVAIHVNDYDDTQLAVAPDRVYGLLTHPSVAVLPAALAIAETNGLSGRDLLLAYHVGVEVECKIAEAISPRHYKDGFHSTGTCGPFGAAAACAKLANFDLPKTIRTLGLAGSQSSGLRENFGTMTKSFHAGHAAESGVFAADLAGRGWTVTDQILEGKAAFFHAYGGSYDPSAIHGKLGNPWTFKSPGISIKPYPSGSLTHPAMTLIADLVAKERIKPADVESVEVGAGENLVNTLVYHRPQDGLQAKFSMEFCVAILLLQGKATLGDFTEKVVQRADVQDMIKRISFGVDPQAGTSSDKMTTLIKIRLTSGRTIAGRADFGKGSPSNPMSYDEVADKFRGCAAFARWPQQNAEGIIRSVRNLEQNPDVRALTKLCSKTDQRRTAI